MADLVVTAANVALHATAATTTQVTYGETVTQGEAVYMDSTDSNRYKLADADLSLAAAAAVGIVITPGDANDKGYIAQVGPYNPGATLTVGEIYVLSGTAGKIAPEADLATNDYVTILGVASAADQLELKINATGVLIP